LLQYTAYLLCLNLDNSINYDYNQTSKLDLVV